MKSRFRLFFAVCGIVVVLVALKTVVHLLHLEFLNPDALLSSVVTGAIFIIGFLLSSILPDYKEAERMPADIRSALEAIYDDTVAFAATGADIDVAGLRKTLIGIVAALETCLGEKGGDREWDLAIEKVGELNPVFVQLEGRGMSYNFIVRLRNERDNLRKCMYRMSYIHKIDFVPSVHVLILTLVVASLFLLLFLKTDSIIGPALVFGFVSYMFVYALHLIQVLERPFGEGSSAVDDVDMFLLRDFVRNLERAI